MDIGTFCARYLGRHTRMALQSRTPSREVSWLGSTHWGRQILCLDARLEPEEQVRGIVRALVARHPDFRWYGAADLPPPGENKIYQPSIERIIDARVEEVYHQRPDVVRRADELRRTADTSYQFFLEAAMQFTGGSGE